MKGNKIKKCKKCAAEYVYDIFGCSKLCKDCCAIIKKEKQQIYKENQTQKSIMYKESFNSIFRQFLEDKATEIIKQQGEISCAVSGRNIYPKMYKNVFDIPGNFLCHLNTKGAAPHLYWNLNNVVFMLPEYHNIWEFGDRTTLDNYDFLIALKNSAKENC